MNKSFLRDAIKAADHGLMFLKMAEEQEKARPDLARDYLQRAFNECDQAQRLAYLIEREWK